MSQIDQLSEDYIRLAFRIHQYIDGYVDAYFGPPSLRDAVLESNRWPGSALVSEAERLQSLIAHSDYSARRRVYLHKQVTAMLTTCRQIAGDTLSYREEIRRCFDIDPEIIATDEFDTAIEELAVLLPGKGTVAERMLTWRKQFEIPPMVARKLIDLAVNEIRQRTLALYSLPQGETVDFRLVSNQPWDGYNWYHGNYHSTVDINTNLPIDANALIGLLAHESYPGHHTENCLKEAGLFREAGWGEHSILLVSTPQAVMAEGIADTAVHIIFAPGEREEWQATHLYPVAGLSGDPILERRIAEATRALAGVMGNAALMLHEERRPRLEVHQYLLRYALLSEKKATQYLGFIEDPLWRSYVFTYFYGERLIRDWIAYGDRQRDFATLLREQTYPSLITQWLRQAQVHRQRPK